jgi:hypothetical protein
VLSLRQTHDRRERVMFVVWTAQALVHRPSGREIQSHPAFYGGLPDQAEERLSSGARQDVPETDCNERGGPSNRRQAFAPAGAKAAMTSSAARTPLAYAPWAVEKS